MENGKKFIGWDEVIADGLSDNATIMWWRSWAPKAIPTATSEGKQVINTENNYFYFDYLQDKTTLPKLLAYEPIPAELTPRTAKTGVRCTGQFLVRMDSFYEASGIYDDAALACTE